MMLPPLVFISALILVASPVLAAELTVDCSNPTLRYDWAHASPPQPLRACISPGQSTVFRLDATLADGSDWLEMPHEGRMLEVARGRQSFTVIVPDDVANGQSLILKVRLADKTAPSSIAFELFVHPSRETRQVRVYLNPRPVGDIEAEVREARAEVQQCRQERAEILAACSATGELRSLLANGKFSEDTVAWSRSGIRKNAAKGSGLKIHDFIVVRFHKRVYFALLVYSRAQFPIRLNQATLISTTGEGLPVAPLGEGFTVAETGARTWVVVDAVLLESNPEDQYTLTLWGDAPNQAISIRGVSIPLAVNKP